MKELQVSLVLAFVGSLQARSANLQSNHNYSPVEGNGMMPPNTSVFDENLTASFSETRTKKFDVINEKVTWLAALEKCKERHTDLATIRNQEENDLVIRMIKETIPNATNPSSFIGVWLGGTRDNSLKGYYWMTDGETVETYENWTEGEPNNSEGNESCLSYYWSQSHVGVFAWDDLNCSLEWYYVCEYF